MSLAYQLRDVAVNHAQTQVLAINKLEIEAAQITALVGANGAGKSTLLQCLAFLHPAKAGKLQFFNTPVQNHELFTASQQVALVQQNPYLLRGTVRSNIELGLRLRRVAAKLRQQQVDEIIEQLSLEDLAQRRVNTLSGGEAQKVAIARALVLKPRALLLDEPFTHLDRSFHLKLESLLLELKNSHQYTIIFSSHDLLRARTLADNVFSLVHGNTVPNSLINLFNGHINSQTKKFDTGRIQIQLAGNHQHETHLAIEPAHIILSNSPLESSIRNSYRGRINALTEEQDQVRVSVDAGEKFEVLITQEALNQQDFNLGREIWLSFKSSSVQVF
jgi:tungstate transport system ATP-binding protein